MAPPSSAPLSQRMTALCSRPGSHHATRASAYDQHLLLLLRCGRQRHPALEAHLGIQGAQEPVLCEQAVVALVAAEAAVAVGIASGSQLVGHFRLADQTTAHENQVGAIIFDYILHLHCLESVHRQPDRLPPMHQPMENHSDENNLKKDMRLERRMSNRTSSE